MAALDQAIVIVYAAHVGIRPIQYEGIDEAYRASVEGWDIWETHAICRDCLAVALTGLGFPGALQGKMPDE